MQFKPAYEDVVRDGIASLPEMEDIQLELPLPEQPDAENRKDAGLQPDFILPGQAPGPAG